MSAPKDTRPLPPQAESVLVTERLHVLDALRLQLEAQVVADRLHWRIHLCQLFAIYQEIEDCYVIQALAPHQAAAPQDPVETPRTSTLAPRELATAIELLTVAKR